MSKAYPLARAPWYPHENVLVELKDAGGMTVAWINKDHPCFQGNLALLVEAPNLANAVLEVLAQGAPPDVLKAAYKRAREKKEAPPHPAPPEKPDVKP